MWRHGIDRYGAQGERERQLRPTDMRMQGKGVQGRYERERGQKKSLAEQEIHESREKVERHNRERDKEKEASETKRYERARKRWGARSRDRPKYVGALEMEKMVVGPGDRRGSRSKLMDMWPGRRERLRQ